MSDSYVKLVCLLKKKPGISFAEFQDYYENTHCKLVWMIPRVQRYFRRYLQPLSDTVDQPYHVITELWFRNREDFEFAMQRNADAKVAEILAKDEENLFDRSAARLYVVDEHYSKLPAEAPLRTETSF